MIARQFLLFLVAGGIAALVNISSRVLLSKLFPLEIAVVLAYFVGMLVAFALMRSQVFKPKGGDIRRQVVWFVAVNLFAVLQTVVVTSVLARWLLPAMGMRSHVELVAHLFGVATPAISSFFGHKYLSFGK